MLGLPLLAKIALIISTQPKAALHPSHLCTLGSTKLQTINASKLAPTFAPPPQQCHTLL